MVCPTLMVRGRLPLPGRDNGTSGVFSVFSMRDDRLVLLQRRCIECPRAINVARRDTMSEAMATPDMSRAASSSSTLDPADMVARRHMVAREHAE